MINQEKPTAGSYTQISVDDDGVHEIWEFLNLATIPSLTHVQLWVKAGAMHLTIDGSDPDPATDNGIGPIEPNIRPLGLSRHEAQSLRYKRSTTDPVLIAVQPYTTTTIDTL